MVGYESKQSTGSKWEQKVGQPFGVVARDSAAWPWSLPITAKGPELAPGWGGKFVADLKVDGDGFVVDYPGIWVMEAYK
jgi:hypothetical protein